MNVNVNTSNKQSLVSPKSQLQTPAANLTYSASSVTHRKPSFKFENNTILNRVHNMNLLHGPKISEETAGSHSVFIGNKRASLNARDFIEVNSGSRHSAVIKRQQSVSNSTKMMVGKSAALKGNQQISLDSGIYSPSDNGEEFVTPVLI